ncbi:MAG: methylmalonyl Co-A mutase-associated GTPase MeaB [Bacteroidota bacterium]
MKNFQIDINDVINGEKKSVARAISLVENNHPSSEEFLSEIFSKTGNAYRIGITGPPGAGKSTLTNKLASFYRKQNKKVGIIAVDPTSPFTGGALLGDRIRMSEVEMDDGVFIRSMASRGSLGGLSKKTREASDILDASGCDIILIETVGVGQSELDVASATDTTIVVLVPESGDSIQAMKAGLMEIADIFVLNKSDRPGAEQAATAIKTVIGLKPHDENSWMSPVEKTIASEGKGIEEVAKKISEHNLYLNKSGKFAKRRTERLRERVKEIIDEKLSKEFWTKEKTEILNSNLNDLLLLKTNPYEIAKKIKIKI